MCPGCRNIIFLDDFLKQINRDKICELKTPKILAIQTPQNFKFLTGKDLLRPNVESEAIRLKIYDKSTIVSAIDHIWNQDPTLQDQFTALADNINNTNLDKIQSNDENLNRITQLNVPQAVNSVFEDNIFNGINFY